METLRKEQEEALRKYQIRTEERENQIEAEVDEVKIRAYGNTNSIRQHAQTIEGLDSKTRSNNLVIEGLTEASPENDLIEDICSRWHQISGEVLITRCYG